MRKKNEDTKIRIYEYINEYIKNNRVSPTINEIAQNAGCAVSTAYKFLERLKDEGLIDTAGRGRITSSVNNWEMGYAPILGMVACGKPKLAVEDIQCYLPLNMDYFGKGEYFLLRRRIKNERIIRRFGNVCAGVFHIRFANKPYRGELLHTDGQPLTLGR